MLKRYPRIPIARPVIDENEIREVVDALERGWVTASHSVKTFEVQFAKWLGVKHAVMTSSGSGALDLALASVCRPGDEVIVPDVTYVATAAAVKHVGAVPVLCDVRMNGGINVRKAERLVSGKTRAILPVHLYGRAVEMDYIMDLARHQAQALSVVEDAAEALGSVHLGMWTGPCGTIGHVGIFSFYGNKVITTGQGGMVVTNSDEIADTVDRLRNHGHDESYWSDEVGWNYMPTELQGALGVSQLRRLDWILEDRDRIASLYKSNLPPSVEFLPNYLWSVQNHWMIVVLLPGGSPPNAVRTRMDIMGVETRRVFPPLHLMVPYRVPDDGFIESMLLWSSGLVLPTYAGMTEEEIEYVCSALFEAL